jgi:hypothetical protein
MINCGAFSVTTTRIYLHSRNLPCYYHQSDTRHFIFYNIKHLLMAAIVKVHSGYSETQCWERLVIHNFKYFGMCLCQCTTHFCCNSHVYFGSQIIHFMRAKVEHYVRLRVFTAVTMQNGVFCDVTPCGSCKNRCFGGT